MLRDVVRGITAGLAGTAAMTLTTQLERSLRPSKQMPVDYDATGHVVTAAANVLRFEPHTDRGKRALFLLVHWGYGSAVAVGYRALREAGLDRERSSVLFFATCQGMAFALFPTLGGTPPPWRWRRDVLASSLGQHAVYVATVAAADSVIRARSTA